MCFLILGESQVGHMKVSTIQVQHITLARAFVFGLEILYMYTMHSDDTANLLTICMGPIIFIFNLLKVIVCLIHLFVFIYLFIYLFIHLFIYLLVLIDKLVHLVFY